MNDWLNNFPKRTKEHVKNDLARNKFRQLFTDPYFIIREEMDNDYGVDICIEALVNDGESPTNIRAHVQLKSSNKDQNFNGSYSYNVSTSNLHYLLNNPGSIYVFYSIENDRFYYREADTIFDYYNSKGDVWRDQKSITVHFENVLDELELINIHRDMIDSALMFKEIRLKMNSSGIQPGAKFVYGELYFESSDELFEEYQEANNIGFVYTTGEDGKVIFMHNLIWESHHGPIPNGYQVYHVNGSTLDNRSNNLDIMKTVEAFPLEEFQLEVEEEQAYNILAVVTQGSEAELKDVPPPPKSMFERVINDLRKQGWSVNEDEMNQLKETLNAVLEMNI